MSLAARAATTEPFAGWTWNAWRPQADEFDHEIPRIEGDLPRELAGTYLRTGPSQRIFPRQGYEALHMFDGDGLVHAIRIADGRAWYRSRFVEAPSFVAEREAGRARQDFIGVTVEEKSPDAGMRQQPNTNVVFHAGKLFAMVENALPFELDPRTLAPRGFHDYARATIAPWMSAHPKIDARTGQLLNHGYFLAPPYCTFYVIEPDGQVGVAEEIDTGYASFMHDNAITENYFIVIVQPITLEPDWKDGNPLGRYGQWMKWRPEKGLRFGVRRREKGAPLKWFDAPNPYALFHPGNAYESGSKIVMDAFMYRRGKQFVEALGVMRAGELREGTGAIPVLYELDLETGSCKETILSDKTREWPRCDPRRVGYANRFGYAVEADRDYVFLGNAQLRLVKYDRTGCPALRHDFGYGQFPMEPLFVPRSPDAGEDEGWVLSVVYDAPNDGSYLAVLDARAFDGEPVAKLHLGARVPMGFHGNWVPELASM